MFETAEFESRIVKAFDVAAQEFKLKGYVPEIPPILYFLARANEAVLLQREQARSAEQRRGMPEALESLNIISMETARNADGRRAKEMEVIDLVQVYTKNYCGIWPFCR
jgi:hypothetical protein